MRFLFLPLHVEDINVTQPGSVCLHPSSFVQGFVSALEHRMQSLVTNDESGAFAKKTSLTFAGVSLIHRDFYVYKGIRQGVSLSMATEAEVDKLACRATSPTVLRGEADIDIVIALDTQAISAEQIESAAIDYINRMKCLGGNIYVDDEFPIRVAESEAILKALIRARNENYPFGWFLKCAHGEELNSLYDSAPTPMAGLLASTLPERIRDEKGKVELKRQTKGFLFPGVIGYQLLEEPKERSGLRFSQYAHAFCEPIYSVIEMISSHHYVNSNESRIIESELLWRNKYDLATKSLYVTTSS